MGNKTIKTTIKCRNIAPLENLDKTFSSSSLKLGIFAGNGSGKTYISRMFRLLENTQATEDNSTKDENTDVYLSFEKINGEFRFSVVDGNGTQVENTSVQIVKGNKPQLSPPNYLFHTFNQDYVDENIKALNYEKDNSIEGFILGKAQIDLSDDEDKLNKLKTKQDDTIHLISKDIESTLEQISNIKGIKAINEYKSLDINTISKDHCNTTTNHKGLDECIRDYDKLKSVPENLAQIDPIKTIDVDTSLYASIEKELSIVHTLSSFADEFKKEIRSKQSFVEEGLRLYNINSSLCPFCGQDLTNSVDAIQLIEQYTKFLNNSESNVIKQLNGFIIQLDNICDIIRNAERDQLKKKSLFDEYKNKYIPSCQNIALSNFNITDIISNIDKIKQCIEEKSRNISLNVDFDQNLIPSTIDLIENSNKQLNIDNSNIKTINERLAKLSVEMRESKREICNAAYRTIIESSKDNILSLQNLRNEYDNLADDIEKKREKQRVSKKEKVAETIKIVLDYFFAGKYTLDEDSFSLIFKNIHLAKGSVRHVLSEGEKNIIAFAYYLGDCHMKVERVNDYNKLFFVIDDPISSMDFTYVYTMSGVIRDIKSIIPGINHTKMLVLTHNNDFMRILTANNIIDKVLLLKNGKLVEYDDNYTVPYINHLLDIYKIARKGEPPSHTTANSIRHIIETLDRFYSIKSNEVSVKKYIDGFCPKDTKIYTYINDLSHGGWRTEQEPIDKDDYIEMCEIIIKHIQEKFPNQIVFCENTTE